MIIYKIEECKIIPCPSPFYHDDSTNKNYVVYITQITQENNQSYYLDHSQGLDKVTAERIVKALEFDVLIDYIYSKRDTSYVQNLIKSSSQQVGGTTTGKLEFISKLINKMKPKNKNQIVPQKAALSSSHQQLLPNEYTPIDDYTDPDALPIAPTPDNLNVLRIVAQHLGSKAPQLVGVTKDLNKLMLENANTKRQVIEGYNKDLFKNINEAVFCFFFFDHYKLFLLFLLDSK